jgi:hypothetical protein
VTTYMFPGFKMVREDDGQWSVRRDGKEWVNVPDALSAARHINVAIGARAEVINHVVSNVSISAFGGHWEVFREGNVLPTRDGGPAIPLFAGDYQEVVRWARSTPTGVDAEQIIAFMGRAESMLFTG